MGFRDNFAKGVDVSSDDVIDWPALKKGGVSVAFIRCSFGTSIDAMFAKNVDLAYKNGIAAVAVHELDAGDYVNALQDIEKIIKIDEYLPVEKDQQWITFSKQLQNKALVGVVLKLTNAIGWDKKVVPDGWLAEMCVQWLIRVKKYFPQYKSMFCSSEMFVESYCASIISTGILIPVSDLCTAYWPYGGPTVACSWEQLPSNLPPDDMTIKNKDGSTRVSQNPPFIGYAGWKVWWFTGGKFIIPGILKAANLIMFNGDFPKMCDYFGYVPKVTDPIPPVVVDPPVVDDPPVVVPDLAAWQLKIEAEIAADETQIADLKEKNVEVAKDLAD